MPNSDSLVAAVGLLSQRHPQELLKVATMVCMTKRLLSHHGHANGVDLSSVTRTLDKCVESYLIENDIHPRRLQAVVDDLKVAALVPEPA